MILNIIVSKPGMFQAIETISMAPVADPKGCLSYPFTLTLTLSLKGEGIFVADPKGCLSYPFTLTLPLSLKGEGIFRVITYCYARR